MGCGIQKHHTDRTPAFYCGGTWIFRGRRYVVDSTRCSEIICITNQAMIAREVLEELMQ
jgi:hypothetical protein